MKKFYILSVVLIAVTMNTQAQWFDFSENKGRCALGIHAGLAGWNAEYRTIGWGASIQIGGVYLDYLDGGPAHRRSADYRADDDPLWNDSTAFVFNVGYQLPVLPWLRVMPIVGYCQTDAGVTDVSRTYTDYSNNALIDWYHPYHITPGTRRHHVNLGLGVFVQPCRWVEFYTVGSFHALYGGVSVNLNAFIKKEENKIKW